MSLINFIEQFTDKESSEKRFKKYRDQVSGIYSKCGGTDQYWKQEKEQYQCKACGIDTMFKSVSVMCKAKLPFRYWLVVTHLLIATKKSFSDKEIQRQRPKRYHPVWHMVHKLCQMMGKRDGEYVLAIRIELDEGYFSIEMPEAEKNKPVKRSRGSHESPRITTKLNTLGFQVSRQRTARVIKAAKIRVK